MNQETYKSPRLYRNIYLLRLKEGDTVLFRVVVRSRNHK